MSNIEKFNQVLSIIYYLIWIPLGLLLLALIIFLIVANPIGKFLDNLPFGAGGGLPGGGQSGFGPPGGGQFGPPGGNER